MTKMRTNVSKETNQTEDRVVPEVEKPTVEDTVRIVEGPVIKDVVKRGHLRTLKNKTKQQIPELFRFFSEWNVPLGISEILRCKENRFKTSTFYTVMDRLMERQRSIGDASRILIQEIDCSGERIPKKYVLTDYGRRVALRILSSE